VAAAGGTPGRYGEVRFFRTADGSELSIRRIGYDTLFRGSFSPNGQTLAVGGPDGAVYLAPVDAAAEVRRLELHSDWVFDVAWSADGQRLISGGRDKATKVSFVETGLLLAAIDASPDFITSVAADGQYAVSAGRAATLSAFDLTIALAGVEISGDGNGFAPINRRDQYLRPFEGQPQQVLDLATSGDRTRLAVAGAFAEVRVYQFADRQRIATLADLPAPIYSVALNADGSRLALGAKNGQAQVYSLPDGQLLKSHVPVPLAAQPADATLP
jgi:WD40 repeat protein